MTDGVVSEEAASSSSTPQPSGGGIPKLKLKIAQRGGEATVERHFYSMTDDLPDRSPLLGSQDLLTTYGLSAFFRRFCNTKKLNDDLTSFLPNLDGNFTHQSQDDVRTLRGLIEKPPIASGKELSRLSSTSMAAFRLAPGPVPPFYLSIFAKPVEGAPGSTADSALAPSTSGPQKRYHNSLESLETPDETEEPRKATKRHRVEGSTSVGDGSGAQPPPVKEKKAKKKKKEKKKKKDDKDRDRSR